MECYLGLSEAKVQTRRLVCSPSVRLVVMKSRLASSVFSCPHCKRIDETLTIARFATKKSNL